MRTIMAGLFAVAGIAIAAPVSTVAAQGVSIETPAGDVRVGPQRRYDRDHDGRRHRGTTGYNERSRDSECRTITVRRDDGSVRRTRRCD